MCESDAYERALDHFQSIAFVTKPRRTGFSWMYWIDSRFMKVANLLPMLLKHTRSTLT